MRTVVVSRGPSAASARRVRIRLVAPAAATPPRKPRRVWISATASLPPFSCLQLAFEFAQKAPIGSVGDDLLRARLDEAGIVQSQGIEPDRVLGVVFPPFVVRQPAESLQRVIVALCKAAIDEQSRSARRLGRAQIGRLEYGPRHPFGGDRILLYEFTTARQHAAEVLRPGAVDGAVEDHMTDSMGVQFLRLGRQAQEPIELSVDEELHRPHRRADDPIDVFARINTDMRGNRRQEHMLGRAQRGDPNSLTSQVGDAADVLFGEYFEATSMHTGQYLKRHALTDRMDAQRRKVGNKVIITAVSA